MAQIEIKDLSQFRRELARVDKGLRKELDKAMRDAAKSAAQKGRQNYRAIYPRRRGTKRRTPTRAIRARARAGKAAVELRRDEFLWLQGQEFGGSAPQFPRPRPHPSGRGSEGNFFYPAVYESADEAFEHIESEFRRIARIAFPDG